MILSFLIIFPLLCITVWWYIKVASKERHIFFDAGVIIAAILSCAAVIFYFYNAAAHGPDRSWWPVLAAFGCLSAFPVILGLGRIFRFIIFKKP